MLRRPPATGELRLLQLLPPQHPSSPTTDAATLSSPRPSGTCTQAELLGHCCPYSPSILLHLWREHVSQNLGMLHAARHSISFLFFLSLVFATGKNGMFPFNSTLRYCCTLNYLQLSIFIVCMSSFLCCVSETHA